jgi:hypothetical protein
MDQEAFRKLGVSTTDHSGEPVQDGNDYPRPRSTRRLRMGVAPLGWLVFVELPIEEANATAQ